MSEEIDKTNITEVAEYIRQNLKALHVALHQLSDDLAPATNTPYLGYKITTTTPFSNRLSGVYLNISRRIDEVDKISDSEIGRKYLGKDEARRQVSAALWLGEYIILNSRAPQTLDIAKQIVTAAENLTTKLGFTSHERFADNGFETREVQKILERRDNLKTTPELSEPAQGSLTNAVRRALFPTQDGPRSR